MPSIPLPLPHAHFHPDPIKTLVPALSAHLPYTLPLLRRLQHHTTTSSQSAKAFATFAPGSTASTLKREKNGRLGKGEEQKGREGGDDGDDDVWAAVFVDRSQRPETEAWIWTSMEEQEGAEDGSNPHGHGTTTGGQDNDAARRAKRNKLARSQLIILLDAAISASESAIMAAALPDNVTQPHTTTGHSGSGEQQQQQRSAGRELLSPVMILGSLNESLLPLLAGDDFQTLQVQKILSRDPLPAAPTPSSRPPDPNGDDDSSDRANHIPTVLCGISPPYAKWLVSFPSPSPSSPDPPAASLPPHYAFSAPLPTELPLVVSRTAIPRTTATLAKLGSQGVRYSPPSPSGSAPALDPTEAAGESATLVAWAFIALDGSLSTLHTEPLHRGRGIAKAVARSLFATLAADPQSVGFAPLPASAVPSLSPPPPAVAAAGVLAHVDIAVGNDASAGVLRSLGAWPAWRVRWVSVDRDALRREARRGLSIW